MFTVSFISVFFSINLCYRQAANSTHMQHNDWYFLYCSVTSSPHTDWNTFTLKMFSRLSQQVELVLLGQMNMGVCSWVQLGAVLHIHIVFKADAALLCKLITCLLLGVCKDLCTTWYDMELIIKLCVRVHTAGSKGRAQAMECVSGTQRAESPERSGNVLDRFRWETPSVC